MRGNRVLENLDVLGAHRSDFAEIGCAGFIIPDGRKFFQLDGLDSIPSNAERRCGMF
jgi:hypothetical protein